MMAAPTPPRKISLTVQWHITTDCANRCRHCYMFDPRTYEAERAGTLDRDGLFAVLARLNEFERDWWAQVDHFALTGGDPLLRPEWEALVEELRRQGKSVSMMGNPETLTPERLGAVKRLGVERWQMSLDGLEPTHDAIRGPGSFRRTVEGLALLAEAGIRCNVMMTVSAENAPELVPLLEHAARRTRAHSFSFDLASQVGNAGGSPGSLTAGDLLDLFTRYRQAARNLRDEGCRLRILEKPSLFRVLSTLAAGRKVFCPAEAAVVGGCPVGWNTTCILADGHVMACRRIPSMVGKLPEQSFAEIFLGSPELRRYRRASQFPACGKCRFFALCRGCPAVNFSLTGAPRGAYPLCFRPLLEADGEGDPDGGTPRAELPMDATLEEEFQLVAGHIHNLARARLREHLGDPEYRKALLLFTLEGERGRFLEDPAGWLAENRIRLGETASLCAMLSAMRHFREPPLAAVAVPPDLC